MEFDYPSKGKNVPPPKDRQPSQGNVRQMPTGPQPQGHDQSDYVDDGAQEYVNDLVEKHSQVRGFLL